jgi:hypothetical protein
MGPFSVGTKQAKFLVVTIDYFTKWVEVKPLATISEKNVKGFVWKAVICRFGIPQVLIFNNGKQFDNGPFKELCSQLNIKNHYSSPGIHKQTVKLKLQTGPYSNRLRPGLKRQRVCGWKSFQVCCGHTKPPPEPQQKKLPSSSPSARRLLFPLKLG